MDSSLKKKKIIFFVDQKHRDFLATFLISRNLSSKYQVWVKALWDFKSIEKIDPDIIIMNKPDGFLNERIVWKVEGRKVISLQTEGLNIKRFSRITIESDLTFFWNKYSQNNYKIKNCFTLGNPRTDLLEKKWDKYFRYNFKKKFNFNKKKKNILISLPDNKQNFSAHALKKYIKVTEKKYEFKNKKLKFQQVIDYNRRISLMIIDYLKPIVSRHKSYNFFLKVHPNDNHLYWNKLKKKAKMKNLHILFGCSINEALSYADMHITSEGCTTTFESCYKRIPTIEICEKNSNYIKNEFYQPNIKLNKNKVYNYKDLENFFEKFKKKKNLLPLKKDIAKYIEYNYCKIDGKRALIYAKQIDKYLSKLNIKNNYASKIKFMLTLLLSLKNLKYFFFSLKVFVKIILFQKYSYPNFKFRNTKKFDHRISNIDVINLKNELKRINVK